MGPLGNAGLEPWACIGRGVGRQRASPRRKIHGGPAVSKPATESTYPLLFPRPGRLARRVGGVNGGACAIAVRRRQAPLTLATRRG